MQRKGKRSVLLSALTMLIAVMLLFCCSCDIYDYSGWKKVEISTDTEYKGTIKIPDAWDFVRQDGWLNLIDRSADDMVLARQCYEGWRIYDRQGEDNWNELEFNPNLPEYYQIESAYEYEKGSSNVCYIYRFCYENEEAYALEMTIYCQDGHDGTYDLFLVFDQSFNDYELLEQMQASYSWGGYIET